jgi:hypothetical protein
MSGLIVVSTIEPDTKSNSYVRLVQIYADMPDVLDRRPVVELMLYGGDQTAADKSPLMISVPGGILY